MDILQYTFFQNALMGIILLSVTAAIIGTYIVTRRMVFIAGGITHASFGGLGIGYYTGISPTLSALMFATISAVSIECMTRGRQVREDSAIAVWWALGMAVGIIFIFLTPGYTPGLTEFLFGNILTITYTDIIVFAAFTVVLIAFTAIRFRAILYTIFDRDFAHIKGINTHLIDTIMMLFIAIDVVLSIRLVGIMLLISLLTIPHITAELFTSRYKVLIYLSGFICLLSSIIGLFLSAAINVPTGACIVMMLIIVYVLCRTVSYFTTKYTSNKHSIQQ